MKLSILLSLGAFCALNGVSRAQTKPAPSPVARATQPDAARKSAANAQSMRRLMSAAGLGDVAMQNAVIEYIAARDLMRAELLPLAREAAESLLRPDAPVALVGDALVGDEAVTEAFGKYRNAVEGAHVQEAEELEKLDARVGFSSNPRLEAFLSLFGVLNDDVVPLGGADAIFAPLAVPTTLASPAPANAPAK